MILHLDTQWDPSAEYYGLLAERQDSVHQPSAAELKTYLISFLNLIAAYVPFHMQLNCTDAITWEFSVI